MMPLSFLLSRLDCLADNGTAYETAGTLSVITVIVDSV